MAQARPVPSRPFGSLEAHSKALFDQFEALLTESQLEAIAESDRPFDFAAYPRLARCAVEPTPDAVVEAINMVRAKYALHSAG